MGYFYIWRMLEVLMDFVINPCGVWMTAFSLAWCFFRRIFDVWGWLAVIFQKSRTDLTFLLRHGIVNSTQKGR